MGQMGFFDLGNRYSGLDAKNEPLLKIDGVVPWEDLRARLEAVWRRADKVRKSRAGRKPWDAIVMFKTIILCALYNLSDDQVEPTARQQQQTNKVDRRLALAAFLAFTQRLAQPG